MYHWTEYYGHEFDVIGNLDNTIYTFDIESTSYLDLYGQQVNACDYLSLSEADREAAIPKGLMYIWQFSINDNVYYGRTWEEFRKFLWENDFLKDYENRVFDNDLETQKLLNNTINYLFSINHYKLNALIKRFFS